MDILQAFVLALVQAFTEFLPISSSAHLILIRWLLGWHDPGLFFDVALHFGTLLALAAYFARTWVRILGLAAGKEVLRPDAGDPDLDLYKNPRLLWYLAAATVPAGIAGLLWQDLIEARLRSPVVVGFMLVAVGCVIWWADRRSVPRSDLGSLPFGAVMLLGCAQAIALIPGTSRSGITIAAGLLLGLQRQAAARFSFLLAMPVVLGASLKTGLETLSGSEAMAVAYGPLGVGVAVSAVAGYGVIAGFLRFLQSSTMAPFVYYRVAFGIIVLVLASTSGLQESLAAIGQDG